MEAFGHLEVAAHIAGEDVVVRVDAEDFVEGLVFGCFVWEHTENCIAEGL